jgi:predicted small secreted protein
VTTLDAAFILLAAVGAGAMNAVVGAGKDHQIEQVGRKVRDMIPFIQTPTEGF